MGRFAFVAIDKDGRERTGAITASAESEARQQIEKRQWMVIRMVPVAANAPSSPASASSKAVPRGRGGKLSLRAQLLFTRQLATLVEASVPVTEALALIAEQQENAAARSIIAEVHNGVLEGQRLTDAMARRPESFPSMMCAAVAGGERSGNLAVVLNRLADFLAKSHALRTKLTTAMVYPAALTVVASVVVMCLMIFVVPTLTEQFQNFGAPLPLITQFMMALSGFLAAWWPLLLAGIVGLVLAARVALRTPSIALAFDGLALTAPGLGRWVRDLNASRFARAASTLIGSGLPVVDSVRSAAQGVGNRAVRKALDQMAARIEEGEPLSNAMRTSGVFPPLITYMAASGENAGALPMMLEKASDHIDQEFDAFTTTAMSLFEPAIIVLMGAIVATIVLSIMLPILQLNTMAIG